MEAFAYAVSHDLRSPLRGIDGWSQALCEDFCDTLEEKAKIYLSRIRYETLRMHELIEALLRLSRIGRREIKAESVDISGMAVDYLNRLQQQEPQRKVEIRIAPDLTVMADKLLMGMAMESLLNNAWKFSSKKEVAQIEIGSTIINNEHVLYVRDNGAGFNPAYASKLFGAFQRMHKATEFPGIGIGLAVVQRIILRHGGNIWVETGVNDGCTFYWITRSTK